MLLGWIMISNTYVQALISQGCLKENTQGLWNSPSFTDWICISTISFPDVNLLSWLHSALTPVKHAEGPPDPKKGIMFNSNKRYIYLFPFKKKPAFLLLPEYYAYLY